MWESLFLSVWPGFSAAIHLHKKRDEARFHLFTDTSTEKRFTVVFLYLFEDLGLQIM